ncbi:MAG: LptF/LptG family permease [Desulfobulbaceae bacterium]|jgi:lipopolysaccharide export system permease protein|nr:LptF/LptG family permease [Desulfobulbaceae bacterium]HKJ13955.1 LptF/LptG family permease [Desulfobulbales bacterium]MDH3541831.1 LptF/LptG family permease [Desulfobulbaceae bacterium]MDH3781881.1 LptF/LptG family permease [Desulfobulbaceae bacterium]MDH3865642.1 LptF/LptG family permease [Desulfobulbaceae bacterium]
MPRLLNTYLINQVLAPFYASLIILTSILFLSRLIPILDIILGYNIGLVDFFRLYAYFTPQLMLFALPMSGMMGVILGTTALNNENELMVLKTSGISLYRMLPPIILVALSAALLTGLFSIYLLPAGKKAKVELAFQLVKEKIERSIPEKRFSESLGDIVLYADSIDQKTRAWKGVYISDMKDPRHPITIISESGIISADSTRGTLSISLQNGVLNRTSADAVQTINFKGYDMNLPLETPTSNPLAKVDETTMLQSELLEEADRKGRNSREAATYLIEFHKRLALPVSCFILTLLGFPLGFLSGPRHKTIGIPLGLAIFVLYYVLFTGSKIISESMLLPAGIAIWLPNLLFLILTMLFIKSVAREGHTLYLEKFHDFTYAIYSRLPWRKRGKL